MGCSGRRLLDLFSYSASLGTTVDACLVLVGVSYSLLYLAVTCLTLGLREGAIRGLF